MTFLCIGYILHAASREDGAAALRNSFLVAALLAPVWLTYNVRSIRLDPRIIQAVLGLTALIVFPPRNTLRFRLNMTDVLLMLLFLSLCASQYLCGALAPLTPADIAATWLSTYFIGRLYFQTPEDLKAVAPLAVILIAAVCGLGLFEALTKMNPVNTLLGKRFGILESGEGYRWGMKRAQGNLSHPIYHGFQLILFLPFALLVLRTPLQHPWLKRLAGLSPLLLGATVFVTVSRGAQVGYIMAVGVALFLLKPRLRLPLLLLVICGGSALYASRDILLETLGRHAGEPTEEVRMITIDGEEVEYTGTKHRLLLLQVYREPLEQAGWLGWGGALQGVEIDPELQQRFGSVDSHYILFYLQYGKIGSSLFIALMLSVILRMTCVAWSHSAWQPCAAGIAGAFIAVAVSMTSVWFAPDYAAVWLFAAGLSGNIHTLWRLPELRHSGENTVLSAGNAAFAAIPYPRRRLIPVTQQWGGLS